MAKKQAAGAASLPRGRKAAQAFQPTRAQRAFVAAAAGLGVPRGVICEMLPGARPGETVSITRDTLRHEFETELRDGLTLAIALVEARVFQRALSHDDRGALTAQIAILNARAGWKAAGAQAVQESSSDAGWAMEELNREERDTLRKLLAKATVRPDRSE